MTTPPPRARWGPEQRVRTLADRVAIVTGSSSGIGRAVALELGRRGAAVVVTSRELSRAAATAATIDAEGGRASAVAAELTEPGAANALIDHARPLRGVGRAGQQRGRRPGRRLRDAGPSRLQADHRARPDGPIRMRQAAGRVMLAAGRGVIVNISSLTGHVGLARRAAYTAAKHGLEGLTKALAAEWCRGWPGAVGRSCLRRDRTAGRDDGRAAASRRPTWPPARRSGGWPSPRRWRG